MPTVETVVQIDAPVEHVYAIARDNRSFPEFMDDVVSLTIIEEEGDRIVSDWVGIVPKIGMKVRWRQEDVWNPAIHHCDFKQVKGDYDRLDGVWDLTSKDGGTQFSSVLNYELRVPGLGPLIGKIIHHIVVQNMNGVLGAIKKRAEGE